MSRADLGLFFQGPHAGFAKAVAVAGGRVVAAGGRDAVMPLAGLHPATVADARISCTDPLGNIHKLVTRRTIKSTVLGGKIVYNCHA